MFLPVRADWHGDDHHERLSDGQIHTRRLDGTIRVDDERIAAVEVASTLVCNKLFQAELK